MIALHGTYRRWNNDQFTGTTPQSQPDLQRGTIPQTHGEIGINPHSRQGACGLDFDGGPGSCGAIGKAKDPFGAEPLAGPVGGSGTNVAFLDFRRGS